GRARRRVVRLEQEPRLLLLAWLARHAHQVPAALELLARELEAQMALAVAELRIELGRPRALVPDHHRAAAVGALRNDSLEAAVLDRMVLDMHREALLARDQARPLGHCPALQDAVELEAEVVVQPPRRVFLNHVRIACRLPGLAAGRLRRPGEIALGLVGFEG